MSNPYGSLDQTIEKLNNTMAIGRIILTMLCEQTHLTDDRALQCRARAVRHVKDPYNIHRSFKLEEKIFFRQLSQLVSLEESLHMLQNLIIELKQQRKLLCHLYTLHHGICTGAQGEAFHSLDIDPDDLFAEMMKNKSDWEKKCTELNKLFEESKWIAFISYPKKPYGVKNPRLPRQDDSSGPPSNGLSPPPGTGVTG